MPKLKFIDLRTKIPFVTDKFEVKFSKKGRKMAQAIAPSGVKSTRFVKKDFVK